jgi:hypothetical protein
MIRPIMQEQQEPEVEVEVIEQTSPEEQEPQTRLPHEEQQAVV